MALPKPEAKLSPEAYLALDREAAVKQEFVDGRILAMSGGSRDHSRIKLNLAWIARGQLEGSGCEAFDSDLRVRVDAGRYVHPDLSIVRGESHFEDSEQDVLLNPTVIVEVLSPSTEARDRGEKWARYRRMLSLEYYVLVGQDQPLVEVFTRSGEMWTFADARGLDAELRLEAAGLDLRLRLEEVYARVEFDREEGEGRVTDEG